MSYRRLWIWTLLLHLFACTDYKGNEAVDIHPVTFKYQSVIDSLHRTSSYEALRLYAHENLHLLTDTDYTDKAYLYSAIAQTYKYSYHHDSAVYYFQKAYSLALISKNISLQAAMGATLLLAYNQSGIYKKQRDTIFHQLNDLQEMSMPLNTKALLLDALAGYSHGKDLKGMSQFFLSKSQLAYDKLVAGKLLQYTDSLNLGAHYFDMDRSGSVMKNKRDKIRLLKKGKSYIGTNKELLAVYYTGMANWYCYSVEKMDTALLYQDSLIQLKLNTGLNCNDLIIGIKLDFCDYYFFKKKDYKLSKKYCDQAAAYLNGVIDIALLVYLKWMQADIDLKEKRYTQSITLLKDILPQIKVFSYAEQLRVAESIATCFDKLGMLDSAVVYYKQIAPLTIEGYNEQQRNIQQEADTRYINKVNQAKIDTQHRSLQYSRNQRLWLLLGLSLALLSVVLLMVIYRNKRKTARKLDAQNTELSNLNLQLKEANETKSKLFGIISHDLRSPISQLYQLMRLQLPDSGIVLDPQEKKILEQETHDATINLLDSMEGLLTWSKTQLQSFNPNATWVDLNGLVDQCVKLLQLQIRNKMLQIESNIEPDILLQTDANFLLTILRNLINNAINASPVNGTVTIAFMPTARVGVYNILIENQGSSFSHKDYKEALSITQTSHLLKGGLGLQVVDELSRKINMTVSFETLEPNGARCSIQTNCAMRIGKMKNDNEPK